MNYGPGDEVVCIDSIPIEIGKPIVRIVAGEKYVVAFATNRCVGLVGNEQYVGKRLCTSCNHFDANNHYGSWRFIKLDKLTEEQHESESITA